MANTYLKTLWLKWKLDYVALFIIVANFFARWQWNSFIGDPDGFYHAKIALFLRQGTLLESLPWMQYTTLNEHFTDHQLLYHLLLVPFINIAHNPLIGVKVATVLFGSLMITTFYWLLKQFKISWPWFWAIMFLTLNAANFRFSLIKTNSLSLLLVWLLIYALFKNHKWLTAILGLIFVWLYGGWALAILIFGIYLLASQVHNSLPKSQIKLIWQKIKIFHTEKNKSINLRLFLYLIGGIILGLVISPYWPQNLYFYYQQLVQIGIINYGYQFTVGGEWYGIGLAEVVANIPHIFLLGALSYVWLIINYKKVSKITWFSFILSFVFLVLTMKSRRYMEYFMPFALFFVACSSSQAINKELITKIKKWWSDSQTIIKIYLLCTLAFFFIIIFPTLTDRVVNNTINNNLGFDTYAPAVRWLNQNTPPHSLVFHSDWDEWPLLFYHNDHNYYLVGLDPTFMHNFDPVLHQEYIKISSGQDTDNLAKKIKQDFGANYVFISKSRHQSFLHNIEKDNDAYLVYQDDEAAIFQLK